MNIIKVLFWGTPEFAVRPLETLAENFNVVAVVSNPNEPIGRKRVLTSPPIKAAAEKHGISVLQPEKLDAGFKFQISSLNPDLFVVAAYGKIIPKEILDIPRFGSLNIHPSLLPRWRGASPIQYVILNGNAETGVTVMLMDEKMDHGPIITNAKYKIQNAKLTTPELAEILSNVGAELIVETIPKWIKGETQPVLQDESKATYCKILKKEDGKIDWSKSAMDIERQIRAFTPWPGSFTFWKRSEKEVRLEMVKADIAEKLRNLKPGVIFIEENGLFIATGNGILEILEIQPEGKKEMNVKDFINGYRDIDGTILKS